MNHPLENFTDNYKLDYTASKVCARFHSSKAFVRGIMGPIGSGKSVACCLEIFLKAKAQHKCTDGVRRSRFLIVRNTLPQLETTTVKTWLDWFPERIFGRMTRKPPYTQVIKIDDIECEIIFIALDKPEDVKKLLSLECTGIWFNEAREIQKELLDAATGRVGRYPSVKFKPDNVKDDNWPAWYGIIMDTNPPNDTHWWYNYAEENGWAIDEKGNILDPELYSDEDRWQFFQQPSGFNPEAENVKNLPKDYYKKMMAGKTKEWINVYVHGKYGFIRDGQPVYGSAYNDDIHKADHDIKIIPGTTIYIGLDFGLTPCAIFAQRTSRGQWQLLEELITHNTGIPQFSKLLQSIISQDYKNHYLKIYGDPAGAFRGHDERTAYDILRAHGILAQPAPTNKFIPRKDSVLNVLTRMIDGKPGFLLDQRCKVLRRGFNGGYKFKRLNVSGSERFAQEPEKNEFSHPHDALQYLFCGGGEYKEMLGKSNRLNQQTVTSKDWSVW